MNKRKRCPECGGVNVNTILCTGKKRRETMRLIAKGQKAALLTAQSNPTSSVSETVKSSGQQR